MPTGKNYPYKNKDWAGKQINIKKNKNNEVIGLTSSEGEYFNRVGNLLIPSINVLQDFLYLSYLFSIDSVLASIMACFRAYRV